MQLDLAAEIWQELRRYINTMDRSDAADGMVSVLIDNGVDPQDIQAVFGTDTDVKQALSVYMDADEDDEDSDDYQELDFDEQ